MACPRSTGLTSRNSARLRRTSACAGAGRNFRVKARSGAAESQRDARIAAMKTLTCIGCGAVFHRRTVVNKYCSPRCYWENRRKVLTLNFSYTTRLCVVCNTEKPAVEFPFQARKYNHAQPYRQRTCRTCWRERYRESIRQTNKEYTAKLRKTVIEGLGGKCACCGIETYEFLSIHHVGEWGKQHRKQFKKQTTLLNDIIRLGFPLDKFECLCWNCHLAQTFHGKCPHKSDNLAVVGSC
jgi:hypothetical protein